MESTNETDSNINLIPQQRSVTFSNPLGLQTLTKRQKLYLWLPQTIGAAILDGAINFAIATAMYRTSPTRVTMWILSENTLAGDMGVTTLIQGVLTFVIVNTMVPADMRKGTVAGFDFVWPNSTSPPELLGSEPIRARISRYFTGNFGLDFTLSKKDFFRQLLDSIFKGLVLSAIFFFLLWPLAILIVAPYYSDKNMRYTWAPQTIKFVYAFALGFTMTPICACIALGSPKSVALRQITVRDETLEHVEAGAGIPNTSAEKVNKPEP